jgi:hypothetical protein
MKDQELSKEQIVRTLRTACLQVVAEQGHPWGKGSQLAQQTDNPDHRRWPLTGIKRSVRLFRRARPPEHDPPR